jgi:hypothetical protein
MKISTLDENSIVCNYDRKDIWIEILKELDKIR